MAGQAQGMMAGRGHACRPRGTCCAMERKHTFSEQERPLASSICLPPSNPPFNPRSPSADPALSSRYGTGRMASCSARSPAAASTFQPPSPSLPRANRTARHGAGVVQHDGQLQRPLASPAELRASQLQVGPLARGLCGRWRASSAAQLRSAGRNSTPPAQSSGSGSPPVQPLHHPACLRHVPQLQSSGSRQATDSRPASASITAHS